MSDDSDQDNITVSRKNKRKARIIDDSDSSDSDLQIAVSYRRRRVPRVASDDSSSESSEPIIRNKNKKARVVSESSDETDDLEGESHGYNSDKSSDSEWESDWNSDGDMNVSGANAATATAENDAAVMSDSSDGQSEKCPICLLNFTNQNIATPETCDHSFCVECIQEWAKNVNTCPVDRQEFSLILLRKCLNGKVIGQLPVERKQVGEFVEDVSADTTYCEVCGQSDREDRMLLCDGCDLGYHMECLEPPLDTVPLDEWFCADCANIRGINTRHNEHNPVESWEDESAREPQLRINSNEFEETFGRPIRLLPRTRQSERVRATIASQREQRTTNQPFDLDQPSTSSGFDSLIDNASMIASSTGRRNRVMKNTTTKRKTKKRKRRRARRRTKPIVVEYEIDDTSDVKFALKIKSNKRRKKTKRKKKTRRVIVPKTVKKRLASHLGMCSAKYSGQAVPDVKVKLHSSSIGFQRSQAGIPTLHLFGQRDELDYLAVDADSGDESVSGYGVALASRARVAANISSGRYNRLKGAFLPSPPAATTPCDILASILDSQTKFYSKNTKLFVDTTGAVKVETGSKSETNNNISSPSPIQVQSPSTEQIVQAPMYPGYGGGGNRPPYGFNNRGGNGYRGGGNYGGNSSSGSQYGGSNYFGNNSRGRGGGGGFGSPCFDPRDGRAGYMDYLHRSPYPQRGTPPFQRGRGAPRFPRRPQLSQSEPQNYSSHQNEEQTLELDLSNNVQENEITPSSEPIPDTSNSSQSGQIERFEEDELDIYSDIESNKNDNDVSTNVQTNEAVSSAPCLLPPPLPPSLPGIIYGSDSDERDSDTELVIDDTEKGDAEVYDPSQPSADTDSEPDTSTTPKITNEEEAVASTSDTVIGPQLPDDLKHIGENENRNVLSHIVQPRLVRLQVVDENSDSEDDCPNMSIYSAQSTSLSEVPIPSKKVAREKDESEGEECPNFSIYSAESMDIAKITEQAIPIVMPVEAESSGIISEKDEQPDSNNAEDNLTAEPDSLQNDEVESSTKDFESAQSSDSTHKDEQPEPDSAANQNEPDSNNMEKNEQHLEENSTVEPEPSESPTSNEIIESDNENQSEEISTTQKDVESTNKIEEKKDEVPKKLPVKIDANMKKDLDRKPTSSIRVLQLYDDSDFEEWSECKDTKSNKSDDEELNKFKMSESNNVMAEIEQLTEAVSEEERSYTPCMDEKKEKEDENEDHDRRGPGIGGLDTELVSEDEKNDFDESQEIKTVSDGEALEINAKDHELDLAARPEDYEEGEIVEGKNKTGSAKPAQDNESVANKENIEVKNTAEDKNKDKKKKQNTSFKKVSKSNKERNYRDKERESKSKEKKISKDCKDKDGKDKKNRKDTKKKERKKEIERYDVRNVIGQRAMKDKFGRDEARERSPSKERRVARRRSHSRGRSSSRSISRSRRSLSPRRRKSLSRSPRSVSRSRRSFTPRKRRSFSHRRSLSRRRSIPRRSLSRRRSQSKRSRSLTRERRTRRSLSRSRSYSPYRARSVRHSRSHGRSRRKSRSYNKSNSRYRKSSSKSKDRPARKADKSKTRKTKRKNKTTTPEPRSRLSFSASPTARNADNPQWDRTRYRRNWTPSWSRSPSPRIQRSVPNASPSWTPPIHHTDVPMTSPKLTVYLRNNDAIKKKKDKRKKSEKRVKETVNDKYKKRRRVDRTPPPSKEVFASGDNILVSVSFNKTNDTNAPAAVVREVVGTKRKRDTLENETSKKSKKDKPKDKNKKGEKKKSKKKDTSNIKPVAIIDLDRSPFKELTPSPRDVIVLSDSDNGEKEAELMERQEMLREELLEMGSQEEHDSAPQSPTENNYINNTTGPKTPPEPQIKFLIQKPAQLLRNVQNPLHDDQDDAPEEDMDPQEELELRLNEVMHKGPNTPPEPPTSPPSSPDAYDPFEPTKSRSPTPEPTQQATSNATNKPPTDTADSESSLADLAVGPLESTQKSNTTNANTNENRSSPLDRVMSILGTKRVSNSPEHSTGSPTPNTSAVTSEQDSQTQPTLEKSTEGNSISVVINRTVQVAPAPAIVKPMVATQAYSSSNSTMITSTPLVQSVAASRQNIFSTTSSANVRNTPTSIPQRIVLPTTVKTSPTKQSPLKASTSKGQIKPTPIKPMQSKTIISKLPLPTTKPYVPARVMSKKNAGQKSNNRSENGIEVIDVDLDFESPYSPGSSDFEDLFEPPSELKTSSRNNQPVAKNTKSPVKSTNAFDSLFGNSPVYKPTNINKKGKTSNATKVPVKYNRKPKGSGNKNQVGVKLDEESLKILDELPNSAVEMQVKDKFLKKLNRQERVVEEVKLVLKPHYNKKHVTKEQYKDILRRAVPKICHNKAGEINPKKIQCLIDAYVRKARAVNRKNSGPTISNPPAQPKPAKTTFWS